MMTMMILRVLWILYCNRFYSFFGLINFFSLSRCFFRFPLLYISLGPYCFFSFIICILSECIVCCMSWLPYELQDIVCVCVCVCVLSVIFVICCSPVKSWIILLRLMNLHKWIIYHVFSRLIPYNDDDNDDECEGNCMYRNSVSCCYESVRTDNELCQTLRLRPQTGQCPVWTATKNGSSCTRFSSRHSVVRHFSLVANAMLSPPPHLPGR